MNSTFPKAYKYLETINEQTADKLDVIAKKLISDINEYEKPSQALRRRFSRGASQVKGIDRNGRVTMIKRESHGGKYKYLIQGDNNDWFEPEERIWVVAMYALWQASRKHKIST